LQNLNPNTLQRSLRVSLTATYRAVAAVALGDALKWVFGIVAR
jgi:hypothetical protein